MCGIFGILIAEHSSFPAKSVKATVDRLFKLSESRGKEASGIVVRVGQSIYVLKEPVAASKLIKLDEYKRIFSGLIKNSEKNQNNLKLLEEMKGKENRNATFFCSIAIAKPAGQALSYTGRCSGIILNESEGANGFGYDPIFYYPALDRTFAQLSPEEKNRVSHRGEAMRKLKNDLERILTWLQEG